MRHIIPTILHSVLIFFTQTIFKRSKSNEKCITKYFLKKMHFKLI